MRVGLGKKTLVLTAGIHGRESVNPVLLVKMLEDYCQAFRTARSVMVIRYRPF